MTREAILDASGFDICRIIPRYGGLHHDRHFRNTVNKANYINSLWNPQPTNRAKVKNNPDIERRIVGLYEEGYSQRDLADWFLISKDNIKAILAKAGTRTRQFGSRLAFYEWENKKAQYHYRCAYCGKRVRVLERDHIIPLSAGGTDRIDNIVPACENCNRSKKDRDLLDWSKFKTLQLSL